MEYNGVRNPTSKISHIRSSENNFVMLPKYFELLYSFSEHCFCLEKNDVRAAWLNLLSLAKKNEGK